MARNKSVVSDAEQVQLAAELAQRLGRHIAAVVAAASAGRVRAAVGLLASRAAVERTPAG